MILEHIGISAFRGIGFLSLPFKQVALLIGENAWGKSSLLDAMTLMLSPGDSDFRFTERDFYQEADQILPRRCHIELTLRAENDAAGLPSSLRALISPAADGGTELRYGLYAQQDIQGIRQHYCFPAFPDLPQEQVAEAVSTLRRVFPVIRLRDARFSGQGASEGLSVPAAGDPIAFSQQISALTAHFMNSARINPEVLRQAMATLRQLSEHYFSVHNAGDGGRDRTDKAIRSEPRWQQLNTFSRQIAKLPLSERKSLLEDIVSAVTGYALHSNVSPQARPLLLLEDPETRLHPVMLSAVWQFLAVLPLQKVVTTNSAELLSMVPLENICRLDRGKAVTHCWQLSNGQLPADELRKVTFHIRVNRPSALFSRCWLLVEGETEVWMINELAHQSGLSLASEGIRVVEFAQAGLKPLLRFAGLMGIRWHVLTDGDQAGDKYAAIARSQLGEGENVRHYLTRFPAADIEQYFFRQGFADVYRNAAQLPHNVPMNMRKIIARAIQHSSKPSLAIAVASEVAERGGQSIPLLLRKMLARVRRLAQGKYR